MTLFEVEYELIEFQGCRVHKTLLHDLTNLVESAASAGFELRLASGFRSIERQCQIWNAKVRGERSVLDDQEQVLDVNKLTSSELVFAILRWSALPGTSRHHWGTDIDVYDRAALPQGASVQLTLAECCGPFAPFHAWLDARLADPSATFFRPYVRPSGGVAPEPWHLSFAPAAAKWQKILEKTQLLELVMSLDIELKDVVARHFDEIYERFIWVPWNLYPAKWRNDVSDF